MCKLQLTTACTLLLCQSSALLADEWYGSDGNASFATPDPSRFDSSKTTPPILARWEAKDGRINFVIKQKPVQPNVKISQSDLEREFISEINLTMKNGKLLDSTMKKQDGYNLFTMTGKGDNGNTTIYLTRKIFASDEKNYILIAIAVGIGTDIRTNADAIDFINSVKAPALKQIAQTGTKTTLQQSANSNPQQTANWNGDRIGFLIAKILFFLIAAAIGGTKRFRDTLTTQKTGDTRKSW